MQVPEIDLRILSQSDTASTGHDPQGEPCEVRLVPWIEDYAASGTTKDLGCM